LFNSSFLPGRILWSAKKALFFPNQDVALNECHSGEIAVALSTRGQQRLPRLLRILFISFDGGVILPELFSFFTDLIGGATIAPTLV
jgi:hypothetical protein